MRKTSTITLTDGGEAKRFKITQMSATKAERWLFKFVLLLGGGTDMAARMVHNHFQHITVGTILFAIDCISVFMAGVAIEAEYALYALICIYVSSKVIDMIMLGTSNEKACYVISSQNERIKQDVMTILDRGVTMLSAEGGWSGEPRPVLLCVLSPQEISRFKAIVRSADESAFVFISDAHEVLGEGFRKLAE